MLSTPSSSFEGVLSFPRSLPLGVDDAYACPGFSRKGRFFLSLQVVIVEEAVVQSRVVLSALATASLLLHSWIPGGPGFPFSLIVSVISSQCENQAITVYCELNKVMRHS